MTNTQETVNHPCFARMWDRLSRVAEGRGQAAHRRELLAGLAGRVLEVGAGNGINFDHYPASVSELVAVEPEAHLRERAVKVASGATMPVDVIDAVGGRLPFEDGSFDAGVVCLVLCSVPDQQEALAELHRVIRPGGELRFYEHVVAERNDVARLMRAADKTFWPRVGGGCHMSRDTAPQIERAGFRIESNRRFGFRPSAALPSLPHVLGVARRP